MSNLRFENCTLDEDKSPIEVRESNVTVVNCHFYGNAGKQGGAVYVESHVAAYAMFSLQDCSFRKNTAHEDGGSAYFLGMILTTVNNCTFSGNTVGTNGTGGAVYIKASHSQWNGTAITFYSIYIISDSRFIRNSGHVGGAVAFMPGSAGTIWRTVFEKNEAGNGGALYLLNDTYVQTSDVTFIQNRAHERGGAVYIRSQSAVHVYNPDMKVKTFFQMENSRCVENHSSFGGCISAVNETQLNVTNSTFSENIARNAGGCIEGYRAKLLILNNVTLTANKANERGGALYVHSPFIVVVASVFQAQTIRRTSVDINNCSFALNVADKGGGVSLHQHVLGFCTVSCRVADFRRIHGYFESDRLHVRF